MNKPCLFLDQSLQYKGSPVEQAQCLLRKVKVGGNVDDPPAQLPQLLAEVVGKVVTFSGPQFASYLARKGDLGQGCWRSIEQGCILYIER